MYESAATGLRSTRFALRIRLHSTFNTITLAKYDQSYNVCLTT